MAANQVVAASPRAPSWLFAHYQAYNLPPNVGPPLPWEEWHQRAFCEDQQAAGLLPLAPLGGPILHGACARAERAYLDWRWTVDALWEHKRRARQEAADARARQEAAIASARQEDERHHRQLLDEQAARARQEAADARARQEAAINRARQEAAAIARACQEAAAACDPPGCASQDNDNAYDKYDGDRRPRSLTPTPLPATP